MTEPCMFPNLHEPFYCRIHADVRLRLTDERCRRGVTLTQPVERLAQVLAEAHAAYIEDEADADDLPDYFASFLSERGVLTQPQPQPDAGLREAAQAVVDWAEMAEDGNVAATDAMFDRIDRLRAALRSTPAASQPDAGRLCPAGCGCRLWTDDADRADCGCDGPCGWTTWDEYVFDVLDRPAYYREMFEASRDMPRPFAALRSTPAAPAHLTVTSTPSSEDGLRHRSTPAAPDSGIRTECSLVGVHAHSFRGPHVFHEWEPGTTPAPRDTVTVEPVREACANCGRSWQSCRDWDGGVFPCCGLCHHRLRALGESPNPTTGDAP